MPRLIVNAGTPQAVEYVLKTGANYVGRGFANDFRLDDPSVSGSHAQIILSGSEVTVKDLGSTNGTFINRAPVTEAVILPGQYLRLGGVELLFQADGATEMIGKATRQQPEVSAPIVGEFKIVGTPMIAGKVMDEMVAEPAQAAVAAIPAVSTQPSASPSPIRGLKISGPSPTNAPGSIPVPAPIPAPAPDQIPAPAPAMSPASATVRATPVARIASTTPTASASALSAAPAQTQPSEPTVFVEPAPLKEPPAAPPIPTGMVEPPAGKTACKYHPNNPGHWLCQTCGSLFCSLCVSSRRVNEGTGYFCRSCGTQCVPVKVKFTPKKEKGPKKYSDVAVLGRSIAFAAIGAVVAAGVWAGLGAVIGAVASFMPGLLCWLTGIICGYGVKIGSQDRPGIIFSMIAVGGMFLGIAMGETAVAFITHFPMFVGIYGIIGLMAGGFSAWRIGGGDF